MLSQHQPPRSYISLVWYHFIEVTIPRRPSPLSRSWAWS